MLEYGYLCYDYLSMQKLLLKKKVEPPDIILFILGLNRNVMNVWVIIISPIYENVLINFVPDMFNSQITEGNYNPNTVGKYITLIIEDKDNISLIILIDKEHWLRIVCFLKYLILLLFRIHISQNKYLLLTFLFSRLEHR